MVARQEVMVGRATLNWNGNVVNLTTVAELELRYVDIIEYLSEIIEKFHTLQPKYQCVGELADLYNFDNYDTDRKNSIDRCLSSISLMQYPDIMDKLSNLTDNLILSGAFYYGKDGRMGWHTNFNNRVNDKRIYFTHNDVAGSEFLYRQDGEIKKLYEPAGWSIKMFDVSNIFWHAVVSKSNRYSFGFRC